MSDGASRLLKALRSSPFWQSGGTGGADDGFLSSANTGLDLIWYFRKFRSEMGNHFSIETTTAHYLANCGPRLTSPNLAFDEFWYRKRYADVDEAVKNERYASGWEHYLSEGAAAGCNPAFWFDEQWYARRNPAVATAKKTGEIVCGFEHYLREGIHTDVLPSLYFHPAWYRKQHFSDDTDRRIPIVDYLKRKPGKRPNPVPFFDPDWYRGQYLNPNGTEPAVSEYEHYILVGRNQAYSPSPHFNEAEYRARYPEVVQAITECRYASALEHYAAEGIENGYFATIHLTTGGSDYRSPMVTRLYERSFELNVKQLVELRRLLTSSKARAATGSSQE